MRPVLVLICLSLVFLIAPGSAVADADKDMAPYFSALLTDLTTFELHDYRGAVIFLNFWSYG